MRFRFESDLDFQLRAVDAVCDLFRGQEACRIGFAVAREGVHPQRRMAFAESDLGVGNRRTLPDDEILANLRSIQIRNELSPSDTLTSMDFTVEMETGTGKTYVYLRTIFELYKRYGFIKFVIVVPSVAIKEGVYKSLQMTDDHFRVLYSGVPFEYFLYDSAKLGQVRNFATSPHIQIMVVTVGAINKKNINNLYKDNEKTGGEKPIDLIKATRSILIVDEPQSVDGGLGGRGKKALGAMDPLCTLRYSATHTDKYHMVYRLDAVDAYERKLVKQIEVASATIEDAHNRPYVRLISTSNDSGVVSAKVELDTEIGKRVQRREVTVQDGDNLEQQTGRAVYHDCRIGEIRAGKKVGSIELQVPGNQHYLREGEAWGDVDIGTIQREMIRRTIREHLDKEKRLRPQGVKVLSLFFIDKVEYYRRYDAEGNPIKGDYALIFEEEYRRLARHPDYHTLFGTVGPTDSVTEVHDGYFSVDKKGGWTDTAENDQPSRDNAERAYNLIMKEKEKLLSFDEPLKFIFSHSALREGWDNPNVFQICALRDIRTERERRQTVGRGLRLCVNRNGERLRGFEVNTLTVVARESYERFAENLQREIERDTGIRFGVVAPNRFAMIPVTGEDGQTVAFGNTQSQALYKYFQEKGHIDAQGRIQESLRKSLMDDNLIVPEKYVGQRKAIISILHKLVGRLEIKNADERKSVRPRRTVLESAEFRALWDRIKHKTTYRVSFNNDDLLSSCVSALRQAPAIPRARWQWRKADIAFGRAGVEAAETAGSATVLLDETDINLPDLLTELQARTLLTRRSVHRILLESRRMEDFKRNPQRFIEVAAEAINRCKRRVLVDGIRYQRIGDESYYAQELFEREELTGYLKNMLTVEKSIYDRVVYESKTEARFAEQLERNVAVKVYAKLPGWFTVPTPLGSYNPDWAILVDSDAGERLYFVVETKASTDPSVLRPFETAKINCGEAHFRALETRDVPARYKVVTSVDELLADIGCN